MTVSCCVVEAGLEMSIQLHLFAGSHLWVLFRSEFAGEVTLCSTPFLCQYMKHGIMVTGPLHPEGFSDGQKYEACCSIKALEALDEQAANILHSEGGTWVHLGA